MQLKIPRGLKNVCLVHKGGGGVLSGMASGRLMTGKHLHSYVCLPASTVIIII